MSVPMPFTIRRWFSTDLAKFRKYDGKLRQYSMQRRHFVLGKKMPTPIWKRSFLTKVAILPVTLICLVNNFFSVCPFASNVKMEVSFLSEAPFLLCIPVLMEHGVIWCACLKFVSFSKEIFWLILPQSYLLIFDCHALFVPEKKMLQKKDKMNKW